MRPGCPGTARTARTAIRPSRNRAGARRPATDGSMPLASCCSFAMQDVHRVTGHHPRDEEVQRQRRPQRDRVEADLPGDSTSSAPPDLLGSAHDHLSFSFRTVWELSEVFHDRREVVEVVCPRGPAGQLLALNSLSVDCSSTGMYGMSFSISFWIVKYCSVCRRRRRPSARPRAHRGVDVRVRVAGEVVVACSPTGEVVVESK